MLERRSGSCLARQTGSQSRVPCSAFAPALGDVAASAIAETVTTALLSFLGVGLNGVFKLTADDILLGTLLVHYLRRRRELEVWSCVGFRGLELLPIHGSLMIRFRLLFK